MLSSTSRRLFCCLIVLIVLSLVWIRYHQALSSPIGAYNQWSQPTRPTSFPTLARVLYLFLCENQVEVDTYSQLFPSASADAIFYCWRENCNAARFRPPTDLYVNTWSSETKHDETLVSLEPLAAFHRVRSRVFIINEKQLNLTAKLTWTTARNKMLEFGLAEEGKQAWRWSFYNFADGDIHTACPLADRMLSNQTVVNYDRTEEYLIAPHFRALVKLSTISNDEQKCFMLIDAFHLSISPAASTIYGASGPMAFPGLLTQVVYHIDAMFNTIHRDAIPFVLPYCARYDARSWWTSQAIFVYRSLCLFGHVLQFDGVHVVRQTHRNYPRTGSPWTVDNDMNLVPDYLLPLRNYLKQNRFVSALALHNYSGWKLQLASETCRRNHTAMHQQTCRVHGEGT